MAGDKVNYKDQFNDDLLEGIKRLQTESTKLFKIYKDAAVSLSKYNAAQNGANESNKKLAAAEKKLEAQENKILKAKEKLTIQYQKDLRVQRETVQQLRQLDIITNKLTGTEAKAAARIKYLTAARKALVKGTENANKRTIAYNRAIEKQTAILRANQTTEEKRITGIGRYSKGVLQAAKSMAVMYLGMQGILTLFRNITGIAIGFEKSMSGVKAISKATDEEFKQLRDNAIQLGSATSKTANEVAGLQKSYALLGFSTQEILDASEATILLSQATGEDLAQSAEIAGATIRGFGMDASETNRVVDVMAASFTSSALNLERFGESMKYVAPAAKSVGLDVEFVTANLAKLADAGIHGSQAGTSFRRILIEMGKAGLYGAEGFKELTSRSDDLKKANDEVGMRAAVSALILQDQTDTIDKFAESLDNATGSAKEMADTQMDNLAGSVTLLSSAWEGFVIQITKGDGKLRSIVDSLTTFVRWMTKNAETIQLVLKGIFQLTKAWIAFNIGVRLSKTLIGGFINNLIKGKLAMKGMATATKSSTKAMKAFTTAIRNNPFGLILSALSLIVPLLIDFNDELDNSANSFDLIAAKREIEIQRTQKLYKDKLKGELEVAKLQRDNAYSDKENKNKTNEERKQADKDYISSLSKIAELEIKIENSKLLELDSTGEKLKNKRIERLKGEISEIIKAKTELEKIIDKAENKEDFLNRMYTGRVEAGDAKGAGDYKKLLDAQRKLISEYKNNLAIHNTNILDSNKEIDKINAEWDAKVNGLTEEKTNKQKKEYVKSLQQQKAYKVELLKSTSKSEEEMFLLVQEWDLKIFEAQIISGDKTLLEKETFLLEQKRLYYDFYDDLYKKARESQKSINEIDNIGETSDGQIFTATPHTASEDSNYITPKKSFLERLGYTGDDETEVIDAYKSALDTTLDYTAQHFADMRELADKDLEDAEKVVERKQELLDIARAAQANGDAYNILAAEKALAAANEQQKKKEEAQRQALRREQIAQSITQAGNLVTASTSVVEATGGIPLLYLPILGVMWATFLKTKATAFAETKKFSKGGSFDIGGGSHASGNDTSLGVHGGVDMRVQKNEKVGIFNDKANSFYGSSLNDWIDEINARKFDLKPQYKSNSTIVNVNTKGMEKSLNTLVKQGDNYTETRNGKRVTKIGNVTTIYR